MSEELTWSTVLAEQKAAPYFQQLMTRVTAERDAGEAIYPPAEQVFNAFRYTPLADLKVVILGQDPYHGPGQAHGLCFSVPPDVRPPPSLKNIYKAIQHDYPEFDIPAHGYLKSWAKQGVFLLNTVLTVAEGQAHSHAKWGWEQFTDEVIKAISDHQEGVVFLLWGAHAQKKAALVDQQRHHTLTAVHPSPLSAHRGFLTCGHFRQVNELLAAQNKPQINWSL